MRTLRPPRSPVRELVTWQALLNDTPDETPNPTGLAELLERFTAPYDDPDVREWLTKRLLVWASRCAPGARGPGPGAREVKDSGLTPGPSPLAPQKR